MDGLNYHIVMVNRSAERGGQVSPILASDGLPVVDLGRLQRHITHNREASTVHSISCQRYTFQVVNDVHKHLMSAVVRMLAVLGVLLAMCCAYVLHLP